MSSAGPFTATVVVASNLSVGSGVIVIFAAWAHLTASARFRARAQGPVSGQLSTTTSWRTDHPRWFPVAFRPPAFASRSSCSRRGVGPSSRSAYRTWVRTPTGLPRSAHTSSDRGGRPLYPGDGGAHPDRGDFPAGRLPLRNGQSLHPANIPSARTRLTRHQPRVHTSSPVRSSPRLWPPGWNGPPLGFHPGLRTPPTRSRTTHAKVGTGHRARTWNYTLNSHPSISNPVVHSLCATSCRTSPKESRLAGGAEGEMRSSGDCGAGGPPAEVAASAKRRDHGLVRSDPRPVSV